MSPPTVAGSIDLTALQAPLVYVRLHGIAGQPYLYGDPGWPTTMSAEQIRKADFSGSHVFLEGCYGIEIAQAFKDAGAFSVVGNEHATWGRKYRLGPSSIVGKAWIEEMRKTNNAAAVVKKAKSIVPAPHNQGWHLL